MARHAARRAWFGRGRTRALLSAGMLLGVGATGTLAAWTDGAHVQGASISSGAMHIDLASQNQVRGVNYAWTGLAPTDMTAGKSVADVLPVRNNSSGDVRFTYTIQASAPGALGAALRVTVRRGGTVSASPNGPTCTGGTVVGMADAQLSTYTAGASPVLLPGQSHQLCVQVQLPGNAALAPSLSSAITFTFPATQVPS